jgi:tetratricopeptide (TPR) repeat protein
MDTEKLNQLYLLAEERMNVGDFYGALSETRKMQSLGDNPIVSYMMSGMLIDIGSSLGDENLIKEGIDLLEKDLGSLFSTQKTDVKSAIYYNLANGYLGLYELKYRKNQLTGYFKTSELNNGRIYLLEALKYKASDPTHSSQMWTNLGNCFDKFGRVVEALECFDNALTFYPDHGMAMANKGLALSYYARLAGDHVGTFLNESHYLLSKALELGVSYESRAYFLSELKKIENLFSDKSKIKSRPDFPGVKVEGDSDFERFLINYCLEKKLYLNICNVCQKCSAAIGDTLSIKSMLVKAKSMNTKSDPFLRLSSYLNQMKQDYVTARFLLILSRYKGMNLDFVDKRVKIVDTYDFNVPNVHTQLVRFAFKGFFDILDKEAIFINDYLRLGMEESRISFRNIWFSKKETVHKKMLEIENFGLNAIFDIYQELEDGRYKKLRTIRNALTHRFFNVKPFSDDEDDENMPEEIFINHTIELAKIVRSSLIYLMNFVYIEEKKRERGLNGKYLKIPAYEFPDELKKF